MTFDSINMHVQAGKNINQYYVSCYPDVIFVIFGFRDDSSIFDGLMEEDEKDKAKR